MPKPINQKKRTNNKKSTTAKIALAFGLIFGGIMTAVGLSQLWAAPVSIYLSPVSQNASPNQTKAVTVVLDTDSATVHGGSIQVNFDSAKLAFVALEPLNPAEFTIDGQQVTGSRVSFEFDSKNLLGSNGQFNLANLKFNTKEVSGTHTTQLTGSATAFEGVLIQNYYPASSLSANIVIIGPQPAPAPSSGTSTPKSQKSGGGGGTGTSEQQPTTTEPAPEETNKETGTQPPAGSLLIQPGSGQLTQQPRSKTRPILIAVLGVAMLTGGVLFYLYHPKISAKGVMPGLLARIKSGHKKAQPKPKLFSPLNTTTKTPEKSVTEPVSAPPPVQPKPVFTKISLPEPKAPIKQPAAPEPVKVTSHFSPKPSTLAVPEAIPLSSPLTPVKPPPEPKPIAAVPEQSPTPPLPPPKPAPVPINLVAKPTPSAAVPEAVPLSSPMAPPSSKPAQVPKPTVATPLQSTPQPSLKHLPSPLHAPPVVQSGVNDTLTPLKKAVNDAIPAEKLTVALPAKPAVLPPITSNHQVKNPSSLTQQIEPLTKMDLVKQASLAAERVLGSSGAQETAENVDHTLEDEQQEMINRAQKDFEKDSNPPDMYELAKLHPESHGSHSLYQNHVAQAQASAQPASSIMPNPPQPYDKT